MKQVVSQPYLMAVNPSLPVRSLRELIALARAKPGAVTYGSSGIGSMLHLGGELLAVQTNVQITHVPYRGAVRCPRWPIWRAASGVQIATHMSAQPFLASGRVRALAVTSVERVPGLELLMVRESGVTGLYEVNGWCGIGATAGTPAQFG